MVRGYEASLDGEWLPLSEQHRKQLENLDEILSTYLGGSRDVPAIAIVGPYGQGKTQLLFHVFRSVLKQGGVAIYTHADRITKLIEQRVGENGKILPSDLPIFIIETIWEELRNIRTNQIQKNVLLTDKQVIDYLKDRLPEDPKNKPIVLLVDELEQAYQSLQDKVETSDRNPIRSLLDPKTVYSVLAFAPRSIYEYELGATLGEGEAESSRLSIFFLPVLSARGLKEFLKIPTRGQANFIWWISRGRARYAIKAFQESQKYTMEELMGFQSFVDAMGQISGVPCFDLDALMDEKGNFLTYWKEVFNLVPSTSRDEKEWALVFKVGKEFVPKATSFFGKLGFSGKYSMILSHHLALLLEAISNENEEAIIKKKDTLFLISATYELTLEHLYDEDFIAALQKELDRLQTHSDLKYSLPDIMEETGIAERVKLVKFLPFDLEKLLELFPFPLSSPQLPGASKSEVDKWLNELGDHPLAEDKEGPTDILFFKDFEHFKKYYENRRHKFCEKTLPEKKMTIILFLRGDFSSVDLPAAALWLRNQGRLDIKKIRPSLLADFLSNALFLVKPDFNQPRSPVRKELEIRADTFRERGDRATARKFHHYLSALGELIASVARTLPGSSTIFGYDRKGVGFEEQYERQKAAEAFFYPFNLAFFPEDTEGLRALAQLRSWSDESTKPLNEFLPAGGGYRTAVKFLPTTDKKRVLRHSESVEAIRSFYKDRVDELESLVDSLSKEEFRMLVDDELSRFLLDAYYESKRFQVISPGEKERVSDYLKQSLHTHEKISEQEKTLKSSIGIGFDVSLRFSTEQQQAINGMCTLLKESDTWRSVVYQRIFFVFAEQCAIAIKNKADKFWKSLNQLPAYEYDKLRKLKGLFLLPDQFQDEVIRYVGVSRDKLEGELKKLRNEAEQAIKDYRSGLHENNIQTIHYYFKGLIDLQDRLESIRDSIKSMKEEILQRYRELRAA